MINKGINIFIRRFQGLLKIQKYSEIFYMKYDLYTSLQIVIIHKIHY